MNTYKVFNDNDLEIGEHKQKGDPLIVTSKLGNLGMYFNDGESWYNINHHSFKLVKSNKVSCFSCDVEFIAEDQNDRPEGYFCDKCITR